MEGDKVFNFVMTEVPPMIASLVHFAGARMDEIDHFLFHQPNRFMLQKLADKMKVPHAKMPSNVVENFGNSSGATIPAAIALNLADSICSSEYCVCMAGFGVGLTWSSMLLKLGNLRFCKTIHYQESAVCYG
jgi:3-oxoacyl-[acyl-carrier-protein] synthase-3